LRTRSRYRAPSLRSSWPCNNIRLISPKNMSNSWRIMNNSVKWLWTSDHKWVVRVRPLFGRMVPGTTSLLLLLLQRRHCSSLILFEHKFVMNIWILHYSSLFLHISILYNFIFLIVFFFCSKDFFFKLFLILTDGYTDGHNPSIYSRGKGKNLLHMPLQHCYITNVIIYVGILQRVEIKL